MESLRQLDGDTADSLATPASPWCQAYQLAFPLDYASSEERGTCYMASNYSPNSYAQACTWRGHSATAQHGGWQFTGDKPVVGLAKSTGCQGSPSTVGGICAFQRVVMPAILIRAAPG